MLEPRREGSQEEGRREKWKKEEEECRTRLLEKSRGQHGEEVPRKEGMQGYRREGFAGIEG